MFLIFSFAFLLGLGVGIVAGTWQKETNELKDFKDKYNL
jgi:hypothetical protein